MLRVLANKSSAATGRGSGLAARETPSCGSGPVAGLVTFTAMAQRLPVAEPQVPRARGHTVLRRAFRTAAVLAFAAVAAATLSERPAEAQTAQTVQPGWQYIPSGISAGQSFRLLFVTSTKTTATSTSISTYNSFVQARAATNTHLSGFSSQFRAVGSTAATDARDNTATTYTNSDKGVPIYWLGGAKVADDYADFYDGSWDSGATKNESGASTSGAVVTWTGTKSDGTEAFVGVNSRALGASLVAATDPRSTSNPLFGVDLASSSSNRLLALSPVITVAAKPKVSLSLGASRIDESGSNNSTTLRATLSKAVSSAVTVTLSASPANKVQFSGSTLTIAASATQSGTVTVTAVDNSADAPDASVRISGTVSGTAVTAPDAVTLTVTDDEAAPEPSGPNKLVGNVTRPVASGREITFRRDMSQRFTTGRHPGGYTLTHLDLAIENRGANEPSYSVTIHKPQSSDPGRVKSTLPGAVAGTLTNPGSLPGRGGGFARFTAPGGGIDLDPGATYLVVIDVGEGASRQVKVSTAWGLDRDGVAHWRMLSISRYRKAGSTRRRTAAIADGIIAPSTSNFFRAAPRHRNSSGVRKRSRVFSLK